MHPIDKEILRAMAKIGIGATPSNIAKKIGVHPTTAQKRIEILRKLEIAKCKKRGNRTYCKIDINELKKKMKRDFLFGE